MPDYIIEPLDTDPDSIFTDFVSFVRYTFPDWNPSEAQLDVIIPKFYATQVALTADMASRVQRAIFRYFGATVVNIPPLPGTFAQAQVQFNISDGGSHLLPANTVLGLTDENGDTHMFTLLSNVEFTASANPTSNVGVAVSSEKGVYHNGLTGSVFMIEMFDWIDSAVVVGQSSGGTDREEDSTYLNRLTTNLGLMSPRPVLSDDFALLAQNIAGVWRAAAIDNFYPGLIETQTVTSTYTTGTFTLTVAGVTTAAIPAQATAQQVAAALGATTLLNDTDVRVEGGPLGTAPVVVKFVGRLAYKDVNPMTANTAGLSGGAATFTIVTNQSGTAFQQDGEFCAAVSAVDVDGLPLTEAARSNLITYLQSMRGQDFLLTWVDPAYYEVKVNATVVPTRYADFPSVQAAVQQQLLNYLSPANSGQDQIADGGSRTWVTFNMVRYLELTTAVENVAGVDHIKDLTFAIDSGAFDKTDKTISAPFSLTYAQASGITIATAVS